MPVHYSEDSAGPSTRRSLLGVMPAPSYAFDYESWTKADLQAELEARGLPKAGNKAELIARLRAPEGKS